MQPRFETISEKKIIGHRVKTTLAVSQTFPLWQGFMRQRKAISNNISDELLSIEVFDPSLDFMDFNPNVLFDQWAAVEVSDLDHVPVGMETLVIPPGLYAVFLHKGLANNGSQTFQYIFVTWLPGSDYMVDDRPHFEVMGEKYKHDDPSSEEEIWVPVKLK